MGQFSHFTVGSQGKQKTTPPATAVLVAPASPALKEPLHHKRGCQPTPTVGPAQEHCCRWLLCTTGFKGQPLRRSQGRVAAAVQGLWPWACTQDTFAQALKPRANRVLHVWPKPTSTSQAFSKQKFLARIQSDQCCSLSLPLLLFCSEKVGDSRSASWCVTSPSCES